MLNAVGHSDNILVHGDNLEALKALLPFYAGEVKCIYIDPPYNTGSAFEHYDDNLEHATWLNMMYPRLKLLREFLREDGSIWISIDDREGAYLRHQVVIGRLSKHKLWKASTAGVRMGCGRSTMQRNGRRSAAWAWTRCVRASRRSF